MSAEYLSESEAPSRLKGDNGKSLIEMSHDGPVLVVLLRHCGCTFHREAIADALAVKNALASRGVQLALVHMADGENPVAGRFGERLSEVAQFSDPEQKLYHAFGLPSGKLRQLFGPNVIVRSIAAMLAGHGLGWLVGDGFQMPGVIVLKDGEVLSTYHHTNAADRPDYVQLADAALG